MPANADGLSVACLRATPVSRDRLLDCAHREPFGDDALRERFLKRAIRSAEQGPGVPGGQPAFSDESLDGRRQLKEAQGVRDRDPASADAARELVVGEPEVLDQLLVGTCFLERAQVLAMEVLDERLLDGTELVGVTNEGGDRREPGALGRPPAALPRDQLIRSVAAGSYQNWLDDADLAHRRGEGDE